MKKAIFIFFTGFAMYSCSKNMRPSKSTATEKTVVEAAKPAKVSVTDEQKTAITKMDAEAPTVTPPVIKPAEVVKESETIALGKQTYTAKCGKCHSLKEPQTYDAPKWVKIVDWMAPKAKLNAAEKENVLAYVSFNAKK